jgi:hypothetical protein
MTSAKQIAANRANARKSTGPQSASGKEIAKLNAVKHGGPSPLPVLPEMETRDAWKDHLDGTLASLQPSGHLETVLVERIALILWRMNRVARFEREITAVGQERVVDDLVEKRRLDYRSTGPNHPDEVRAGLRDARRSLGVIAAMYRKPDTEPMTGEDAEIVLSAVGGRRWWFTCPLIVNGRSCGRRVGKRYLPPGARYFGRRRCHDLTYTSCQESHRYDRLFKSLAADTGVDERLVRSMFSQR